MNNAPISEDEIYNWFRLEIVNGCRAAYPEIDFDELDTIKALFSVEVRRFEKGIGAPHKHDQFLYNEKLAEKLSELSDDPHQLAVAYTRYCATERRKLPIIVVDTPWLVRRFGGCCIRLGSRDGRSRRRYRGHDASGATDRNAGKTSLAKRVRLQRYLSEALSRSPCSSRVARRTPN
jgi:hypothetical protein